MSMKDNESPNTEEKKQNISSALSQIIMNGKIHIKPWNIDEVERVIQDPPVLNQIDDPEPCRGRSCLNCTGCDSFRINVSELRELNEREEPEGEEPAVNAAEEALNDSYEEMSAHQIQQGMNQMARSMQIQFSRWDVLKFCRDAIHEHIKVDIFKMRSAVIKRQEYKIKKSHWELIRLFLILVQQEKFFDDIYSSYKTDECLLFQFESRGDFYAHGPMLFIKEENGKVMYPTVVDFINSLNSKDRQILNLMRENMNKAIETRIQWQQSYNGV